MRGDGVSNKPLRLNLSTMALIDAELQRACDKHDWTGYDLDKMLDAVYGEDFELGEAHKHGDIHGEHGIIREALQGIVTRIRLIEAIK